MGPTLLKAFRYPPAGILVCRLIAAEKKGQQRGLRFLTGIRQISQIMGLPESRVIVDLADLKKCPPHLAQASACALPVKALAQGGTSGRLR